MSLTLLPLYAYSSNIGIAGSFPLIFNVQVTLFTSSDFRSRLMDVGTRIRPPVDSRARSIVDKSCLRCRVHKIKCRRDARAREPEPCDACIRSGKPEDCHYEYAESDLPFSRAFTTQDRQLQNSLSSKKIRLEPNLFGSSKVFPRRLINTHSRQLVTFRDDEPVPEYAIVSHRWGEGEIGLDDYLVISIDSKLAATERNNHLGFWKITMACEHAQSENISWIWIDTCCIDKGSHEDVARNIKSMYAYYQNAGVCYAYLYDVSSFCPATPTRETAGEVDIWSEDKHSKMEVEESDWFSRGWTLQELLAPKEVIFFDKDWVEIGRRSGLTDTISLRTGIPEPVLEKRVPLLDVDIVKRLCWSVNRQTTKPEDQAYCLLGILGVSMEPNYGEGIQIAYQRLKQALIQEYPGSWKVLDGVDDLHSMLNTWSVTSRVMVDELDFDSDYSSDSDARRFRAGRR